ncbi:Sulfoacetaldehyde reductase 2 [compost metagenome]
MRKELRPDQYIRVTLVSPGAVDTELGTTSTDEDGVALTNALVQRLTPISGEDIASAVLYAIEQPASVSVYEVIVAPTSQR